ncbi:fused MFS/spermidine synthase [Arcanobacterium phocisimile]|uniref:Fused MFS/spermidine synthase n=1 Tax=Arcanobacterium phocisimile TaxID=1302235 RepID=A0ABX7IKX7_9ACTO|nr:fused MFS/spermidine synthase [Arcanobacterium phocisimile]QRV02765.1 fused MFS/spermidine synthase [Arcanobacterium phocisimile]
MARRTRIDTFDTASSTIRIDTRENLRTLFIDDAESSAIDLSDPTHLEFEYMQHIRVAVDASFPGNGGLRVLHLGGAGCALARCFAALRPRSRQLAIEIDPELATIARAHFDLPASPALRIRTQDARTTLDTNSGKWQVIVRDTFMDGVIPQHMATVEAYIQAARLLAEDGIYCVNIADRQILPSLYREVGAASGSFAHLAAITDPAIMKKRRYGNVILLASHSPIAHDDINRALRKLPMPAQVVSGESLLRQSNGYTPLTDQGIGWPSSPDPASD